MLKWILGPTNRYFSHICSYISELNIYINIYIYIFIFRPDKTQLFKSNTLLTFCIELNPKSSNTTASSRGDYTWVGTNNHPGTLLSLPGPYHPPGQSSWQRPSHRIPFSGMVRTKFSLRMENVFLIVLFFNTHLVFTKSMSQL